MKKLLLLLFLFSTSLTAFSQDTVPARIDLKAQGWIVNATPDTLRAIILVTMCPNCLAHARMGFVVIEQGKRPVYLDCNKKALKLPQVGWGYELIDPNYKR